MVDKQHKNRGKTGGVLYTVTRRPLRPWWILLLIPLIAGVWRVRLDTEVLNLLPGSIPVVRGLQLYQRHFINPRELIITVRTEDAELTATAAKLVAHGLREKTNLVDSAIWQAPWTEHPDELASFIAYLRLNGSPEQFAELAERLAPKQLTATAHNSQERLATSMSPMEIAQLSHDPFGFTRISQAEDLMTSPEEGFSSADGTFRAVFVEASHDLSNYRASRAWILEIQRIVEHITMAPGWPAGTRISYSGAPAFMAEVSTNMSQDIAFSVTTTLLIVILLFWFVHRSWRPLFWLVVMLILVTAGALATAGMIFGTLNAISVGFGAILIGLAVDYGLVLYQEAATRPDLSPSELRRILGPGIAWSAITTSIAFLLLNLAGLPGLAQLGTIVGVGMLVASLLMLFIFLPLVSQRLKNCSSEVSPPVIQRPSGKGRGFRLATSIIGVSTIIVIWLKGIPVERGNRFLEAGKCSAQIALNEFRSEISRKGEPLLVVVTGEDEKQVGARLAAVTKHFKNSAGFGTDFRMSMPDLIWPNAAWQRTNATMARELAERTETITAAAIKAGFRQEALHLTENVLNSWRSGWQEMLWPTNASSRLLLQRFTAHSGTNWLAVGAIYPNVNPSHLAAKIDPGIAGVWLTGWPLLGGSLMNHVEERLPLLLGGIALVLVICLRIAFRGWKEVVISICYLGFCLLALQAIMSLSGMAWNLISVAALPLMLGAAVDYSIHVQLSLRRNQGNIWTARQITGRALLLCALTTVIGFGSNVESSNPGLASLSLACAIGVALAFFSAVYLVPAWWVFLVKCPERDLNHAEIEKLKSPSATYGPKLWRVGLTAARVFPRTWCKGFCLLAACVYRTARPARQRIIEENLLPVFNGDQSLARRAARALLANFALKILDLMRHESGANSHEIKVTAWSGYDILREALERKRGVLLVTPHLGNWEFGGYLLAQKGVRLLVLTQPEPGRGFTELRRQARERWGIDTVVVGEDFYTVVTIIKRLQEGATVALLMDRPPANTGVQVTFFGKTFRASIAAAELARASGCALVPVYVVSEGKGYSAHVLPEINYDRRALGSRAARIALTGEIMRAFEPSIRQYADQWYHFVPMWSEGDLAPHLGKQKDTSRMCR